MWKFGLIVLVLCGGAFVIGTMVFSPKVCISCDSSKFKAMADSGEYKIIDVRTEEEYAGGHLANAAQIDFYKTDVFKNYLGTLDKNAKYLIYCRSGNRSRNAMEVMRNKGFISVADLAGGITAWEAQGLPVVK